MNNGDKSAYPEPFLNHPNLSLSIQPGITKREYYAGLAMQGILSNNNGVGPIKMIAITVASDAVVIADELLKALES